MVAILGVDGDFLPQYSGSELCWFYMHGQYAKTSVLEVKDFYSFKDFKNQNSS